MTTKLKIDLADGVLEVEGTEAFVTAIYNDFKAHFLGEETVDDLFRPTKGKRTRPPKAPKVSPKKSSRPVETVVVEPEPPPAKPEPEPEPKPEVKVTPPKPSYTFLEDLDLSAAKDTPSLVEFTDAKFPFTNEERNLVFVYYLQNVRQVKPVTVDHVYTCYRAINIRAPLNIEKSLHMAANWLNISKTGNVTVAAAGKRYVENQLPKKVKN